MNMHLSDDILGEILLCLPDKSAVRCKILSKKWHDFISLNKPIPSLLGFFCTKSFSYDRYGGPNHLGFIPTSSEGGRILNPFEENLQLVPPDESLSFLGHKSPYILGSSNGLLLCSKEEFHPKTFFVCNPMNKQWIKLPTPKSQSPNHDCHHGFISSGAYTCLDMMHSYKAVRAMPGRASKTLTIEIFSSSDSLTEWKVFNLSAPFYFRLCSVVITEDGVIYVDARKWNMQITRHADGILVFDQREQEQYLKFLEFPTADQGHRGCLGVADGLIRYAHHSLGHLKIWLLNENDFTREWTPMHKVSLEFTMTTYHGLIHSYNEVFLEILAIHPLNPKIVFLSNSTKKLVFYVQDSKLELLCHNSELANGRLKHQILPYTYALTSPRLFLDS